MYRGMDFIILSVYNKNKYLQLKYNNQKMPGYKNEEQKSKTGFSQQFVLSTNQSKEAQRIVKVADILEDLERKDKDMTNEEVKSRLYELSDEKYKEFSSSLIPDCYNMIGVRIPKLRTFAKELAKNYKENLENTELFTEDTFEEIMLKGLVIGYAKCELKDKIKYVKAFVPKIDNWSVNDTFCSTLKFKDHEKEYVYQFLMEYAVSDNEFEQRFVAVMLMDYFLEDEYIDRALDVLDSLKFDGYYTKMGVAWAIATAYAKYPEKTYRYMVEGNTLDDFTYNKAIQKMIESYRVTKEDKERLRKLRR